ncbi:MAG: RluA family pseudouridine synthase [Clostridia bacterium]|nr:RluA family pseudouridine synthase [Clostridia bacterium]
MYNSIMRKIYVKTKQETIVLSNYLLNIFPNLKKSVLFKAIRNKDIRVNEIKTSKDIMVKNDDLVTIYITDTFLFNLPKPLKYIYHDDNIIAVYKPQGLLSNTEYYDNENLSENDNRIGGAEPTLEALVTNDFPNARICHRLDRNTCGIVLFSSNDEAYSELIESFKRGYITKEYIAYVSNANFEHDSLVLENYILKDPKTGYSIVYDTPVRNSQKIITSYTVLEKNHNMDYAILSILIPTGKTHQIRAQMKQINHPIIGDSKYGKNEINKKFRMYQQMLFAYRYAFDFPNTSVLHYLNNILLKLDEEIYIKKLGE